MSFIGIAISLADEIVVQRECDRMAAPQNRNFLEHRKRPRAEIRNFGSTSGVRETGASQKAPPLRTISTIKSNPKERLDFGGWRSSDYDPLLCSISLFTGDFTWNSPKSELLPPRRRQFVACVRAFIRNSLAVKTRNKLGKAGKLCLGIGNVGMLSCD